VKFWASCRQIIASLHSNSRTCSIFAGTGRLAVRCRLAGRLALAAQTSGPPQR